MKPSDVCFPQPAEVYVQCQGRLHGTAEITHWYGQTWLLAALVAVLVILVGTAAFMAYSRHKVSRSRPATSSPAPAPAAAS